MRTIFYCFTVGVLVLFMPFTASAVRDSIRVGIQLEPPSLDPTTTASSSTGEITYDNIYEGLTKIDRDGNVQPLLARSWDISSDGLTYTFTLQNNVHFHDGSKLTPEIVVFSLKRLVYGLPPNPQKDLFEDIASIELVGSNRVKVTLSEANSDFLFNLGLPAAVIVHPDSTSTNPIHPIGTGPYAFKEWIKEDRIVMDAFSGYWGASPSIRHAEFIFTPSRIQIESALAEGLVDGYQDGSGHNLLEKFASRRDYVITKGYNNGEIILAINNGKYPLNDIRVRRALAYAIDKKVLEQDPDLKSGQLIGSHFSPRHPAYIDLTGRYPYNPDKARELLHQAGVEDGFLLSIAVPPTSYAQISSFHIASQLEAVGLKIKLIKMTWAEWMSQVFTAKDYDLTIICHIEPFDIHIYAKDEYYFNYDNARFKKLWRKIKATQDQEEGNKLLGDAQRMIAEDCVNVFLYMKPQHAIWRSDLQGAWVNAPMSAIVLSDMHWIH
ncbi:ABC transporter substrate-binding protein [Desulfovibrio inopinatus]|uniref:ABC transporter substrate-binding protein n=1 Tax=Desulfovibrio inopinatus TaxID=102109 RepID=UPI000419D31E|nr:ABC transporter substrate-binding protein [Desulfovibrio inopinatus]